MLFGQCLKRSGLISRFSMYSTLQLMSTTIIQYSYTRYSICALRSSGAQLHARRPSRREYERYLRTLHALSSAAGLRVWATEPNPIGGAWTGVCPRASWLRPLRPFGCALEFKPCCHMRYYLNPRLGACGGSPASA